MKALTATEIRRAFLEFFEARDHRVVKSYSLIPPDDPTLFFVNAGMVQFKDIFIGARPVDYARATSVQRCLRVSGKHNDLENVGRTRRHHTLFEMLGNFSFGDYFKQGAIEMAWEFLTKVLDLPVDKLLVTVHPDDDEAFAMWRDKAGVDPARILRDPENFWSMGDTGPCGPCSEIHIDLGPELSGGQDLPFGHPDADDRYLELWNLVFMQFDRAADGTMSPLPKPSIDTGAGLERLAAVLQGKTTNWDTDLFLPVIHAVAKRAGVSYGADDKTDVALRVIADHTRAAAFLIADGVYPDNEGRGYVLRRVMRRAIRFGRMLGITEPFLVNTTRQVVEQMGEAYPELVAGRDVVERIVLQEETRFGRTVNNGLKRLDQELAQLASDDGKTLDGRVAFELYDTHGFPLDLTDLICEERGVTVDHAGFETAMQEQRERARAASKFGTGDLTAYQELVEAGLETAFVGYDAETSSSTITALLVDGTRVPRAAAGQRVELVAPVTPFYAESGGQVGDIGTFTVTSDGEPCTVRITDTQRPFGDLIVHVGTVEQGHLVEGADVTMSVDGAARDATRRNHSATHLLHHALRTVLGDHVRQRGSLVGPDRLRFDFSHTGQMTPEEMVQVDLLVNELVLRNEPIETELLSMDEAMSRGAIAFFEEKYGDQVRVLSVGSDSVELCGGTHATATGDIGLFKLVNETAISSGVRRVEGVTGMNAVRWVQSRDAILRAGATRLNVSPDQVLDRLDKVLEDRKRINAELETSQTALRVAQAASSLQARQIGDYRVAAVRLDGVGGREIRGVGDTLRDRLKSGALLVAAVDGAKVSLLVAVTQDAKDKLHAGKLIGQIAPLVGGRGGGRPDMAQAGGSDPDGIEAAMEAFYAAAEAAFTS